MACTQFGLAVLVGKFRYNEAGHGMVWQSGLAADW